MKSERYSRFTLQPAEDGERHVEVKLSDGATEAEDQAGGSPSFRPAPPRQKRSTVCYLALGILLIFVTGTPRSSLTCPSFFIYYYLNVAIYNMIYNSGNLELGDNSI